MVQIEKKDVRSLNLKELTDEIEQIGEKKYRAKQIYEWIHKKQVSDLEEMTSISKKLQNQLKERFEISKLQVVDQKTSADGSTIKFLFQLYDGQVIESVWMKYHHGNSVCVSSQVGCRMGCQFCASTLGGLERNLSPSEMLGQVYEIQKITKERVSHVVVMGTGEPLDNYTTLLRFIQLLSDENGLNISQRNVTVSTCGLVEKIDELAKEKLQITLAISLHAPNDEIRKQLMPIANKYLLKDLIQVCKRYYLITGRRITFEYSLIKGINDQICHAQELCYLLKDLNCHVNLIPVNPIKERDFNQTKDSDIHNFKNILEKNRINVTIRREMGTDIDAACGQLRKSYMDERKEEG